MLTKSSQIVSVSIDKFCEFCQIVFMNAQIFPNIDEKQGRILSAAIEVFSMYGVKRASMEDIARGAGMSRAALYQYFRNKDDILAHGVVAFFDMEAAELREALRPGRPVQEAVMAGCCARVGPLAKMLLDSPHGEEMLAIKSGEAARLAEEGNAKIAAIWTEWLDGEAAAGRVVLPDANAAAVAEAIIAGQFGQKTIARSFQDYLDRVGVFAGLMARSLKP